MDYEDLMKMSDDLLENRLSVKTENLFKLYDKLDLNSLRLGIMALSIHDSYRSISELLEIDELLLKISHIKSDLNLLYIEKSRRERLKK